MALTYGFFNSMNHDRVYNADDMSTYFKGLITEGVYKDVGNALQVINSTGLKVQVSSGRAIIGDFVKWMELDNALEIELNAAHPTLNRYTAIVIRCDYNNRSISILAKDGSDASDPVKPALIRNNSMYEMCLAYIYIPAAATSIIDSNIEDVRGNNDVCGWVKGAIEGSHIQKFNKVVTLASGDSRTISLDMTGYTQSAGDIFFIYLNGLKGIAGTDYTVGSGSVTVNCEGDGDVVEITVLKSIVGEYYENGTNIEY